MFVRKIIEPSVPLVGIKFRRLFNKFHQYMIFLGIVGGLNMHNILIEYLQ